jgi:hypothetical protein
MIDKREAILARLVEIAAAIDGVRTADRNVPKLDDSPLPAIVVLDGEEEADDGDYMSSGKSVARNPLVPRRVHMTPHLLVALGEKPEQLGPVANTLRARIYTAVVNDADLKLLVLNGTGIKYDGLSKPRDESGRLVLSQFYLRFTFTYILNPADLISTA